jgi:uncharacterized membrane protein
MDAIRRIIPLAVLFIVCDLPWLYTVGPWSQAMVKKIQGGSPMVLRWEAAPPVYIALAYLLLQADSMLNAFLIGLCTYAVYDYTNYATLTNYEPMFAIADTLWGGILFVIVRFVAMKLNIL